MPPASPTSLQSYDAVPYSLGAFPETDPDRLAVLANLFHLQAAPPHRCRVLELGCASGGNLIPQALAYPDSTFVGIDLSERQIADGNALLQQLSLENVKLLHLNIMDITPSLGTFDYILAHGVYSWVPPFVQSKILEVCRDNLSPNGVAYVSYNTLPGWRVRGALRDLVLYHTRDASKTKSPMERVRAARQALEFLEPLFADSPHSFHAVLAKEMALLKERADSYLLHEYLEEFNEPLHFYQFIARAQEKDLQYLADAQVATMSPERFGPDKERALRQMSPDPLALEQSMDFLCNRTFRQSLLCHRTHPLERTPNPDAIQNFYIASPMKPQSTDPEIRSAKPEVFIAENRPKLTTPSPLIKAMLVILSKHYPLPIPFADLLAQIRTLLGTSESADPTQLTAKLLHCYIGGAAEFTASPPRFVTCVSERPETSPYIRTCATQSLQVTNLQLTTVILTEPARLVLTHLDGTNTRDQLAALLTEHFKQTPPPKGIKVTETPAQLATRFIDFILPNFARSALLTR